MDEMKTIQWFPGHMAKTRRKIKESLPLVDMVVEVLDARLPLSSRNPELDGIIGAKPRMVVLNKADVAAEGATAKWIAWFAARGIPALAVDCRSGKGLNAFMPTVKRILADKIAGWEQKGMAGRAVRLMVVGIPNVGKSSFINRLTKGSGKAKVEDRPGVTRQNQWFVIEGGAQLLDTPGVLWPKFDDQETARKLAYTGAVRDEVMDVEELAWGLLKILAESYRPALAERYKLAEETMDEDAWELLQQIGAKRGMLMAGGAVNTERASVMLLDEFRGGKLGRITLEMPPKEG